MFKIGDVVIYGIQGVCKITNFETKAIGKNTVKYYVLKPVFNENTSLFVPVDNSTLTSKMKYILTKQQAQDLLNNASDIKKINFDNENQKREQSRLILSNGDREQLIAIIKTIKHEKDVRNQSGKKLNVMDEQTLHKAEQLLYNELSFVFGKEVDQLKKTTNF